MSQRSLAIVLALAFAGPAWAAEPAYVRMPSERGGQVVFTAEGDLWRVPLAGGSAQRLTTHAAEEGQAAIAPDGQRVAFAAAYDGAVEAYVMPLAGGDPKRVSFDGGRVWVQGWTPQGEVVYSSEAVSGPSWTRVLRAVDPDTLAERELPLADANEAAFGTDGSVIFTRFGLHLTGDNAREYRGGAMPQLWRWSGRDGEEATRLLPELGAGLERPMLWNGRLIVVSDADGTDNLWSMNPDGSDRRQLTAHREFEVRGASLGDGRVVYQLGAALRVLDLATGDDRAVPVTLASDREQRRERWIRKPLAFLDSASFAAAGDRVALTARGRVALAGVGPLRRVEIAPPPGARLRGAVVSVDARHVFAVVAQDASQAVWRFPADGSGAGERLADADGAHIWSLHPSPDGEHLAFDDKRGRLWLLRLDDGRRTRLDATIFGGDRPFVDITWSPDGDTLAYARPDTAQQRLQLVALALARGEPVVLSSDRYESYAPAFSPDGRWLYFLSNRNFQPTPPAPWGDRNTGAQFDRRTKAYALALQPENRFPFRPQDELVADGDGDANGKGNGKAETTGAPAEPPAIVWDGLAERLYELPLAPGNYSRLEVDAARLYLLDTPDGPEPKPALKTLAIARDAPQPDVFLADVRDYALSGDRKKLYLMKWSAEGAGEMLIVDAGAKAPADTSKAVVRVGDWALPVVPGEEWRQMFLDAWRMHRDFTPDPAMRGQDWDAVRRKYEPLLAHVGDRAELDDLLAQMIAELGLLHSQVRGAELRRDEETAAAAALGADYEPADGGVRIARIWRGDPEQPSERAPLAQPGVDAREGDVVRAVNGRAVRLPGELVQALHGQAGQQVLLELQRGRAAPHRAVVVPVAMDREAVLRYGDWVQRTREAVERVGGGRIGYLHLRAMGASDFGAFVREFYANVGREGLIIDVRRNRGGNIDSWVIEKLLRRAWAFWEVPGQAPFWNMQQSFRGHLVVLADALTYSDGETFSAGVRALGLAPVIGQRTAGAGIWLSDRNRLSDNGTARIAEFPQHGTDGRWLIEGRGVDPDVAVDNPPHASWKGEDAQLLAALAHLERRLREAPVVQPPAQPMPPRGETGRDVK